MNEKTHYEVLGIAEDASAKEVVTAYRRLAMKWHPDRHDGDSDAQERFKDIGVAFRVLKDPALRAAYDEALAQSRQAQSQQANARASEARTSREDTGGFKQTWSQDSAQEQDEAQQTFFTEMLEIALGLAAREFGEDEIRNALIALGCPESMARAVAPLALRSGARPRRGEDSGAPPLKDPAIATWDEALPFYVAAMGAEVSGDSKVSERFARYIQSFRSFHTGSAQASRFNPAALFFNLGWLGYKKLYKRAAAAALLYVAVSSAPFLLDSDLERAAIWALVGGILVSVWVAMTANRALFNRARAVIFTSAGQPDARSQLDQIRRRGGSSVVGLVLALVLGYFTALPAFGIARAKVDQQRQHAAALQRERDRMAAEAEALVTKARQDAVEAKERGIQVRYDQFLDGAFRRFPIIDRESNQYSAVAENWVVGRLEAHINGGIDKDVALRMAINDLAAEVQRQQAQQTPAPSVYANAGQPQPRAKQLPAQTPTRGVFTDAERAQNSQILCTTFASACR